MSEQKLEIFNVLNFLNKGYELEYILTEGNFGTFPSAEECIKYLVDEGYLSGDAGELDEDDGEVLTAEILSERHTVAELKDLLREHGLKVSGKKHELIERLLQHLKEDISKKGLDLYDEDNKESLSDFELTDKAYEFLKENQWIDLYMYALVFFDFSDYEKYYENSNKGMIETALNFCDEVISRALIANQFIVFIDALSAKAHVYAYDKDYDSFLDYDLQRYILGLNPIIMLDPQTYASYQIINPANVYNISNVVKEKKVKNLRKRFNNIWNKSNIKHATIPKKTSYKLLERAMDGADIDELNLELRVKYFDKKFGIE